jgi:MoaA/NifB/PqqE/SkfB family radical SAM enzyme
MDLHLPATVCFRVTRYCNARCGFCLAPPDGAHPPAAVLIQRIDWLMAQGVKTVHFCGGEPTIHPALPALLRHVQAQGGHARMTTNGIALSAPLLTALRDTGTKVKVSLHGDKAHHDAIVGRAAFDLSTSHLRQLLAARIPTAVQTTVVAEGLWVLDWVVDFCLAAGVRQLGILPFIPRGSGYRTQREYGLSPAQRTDLREAVRRKRHALSGRLDVRWLDFSVGSLPVMEADGRLLQEGATEALDKLLCTVPTGLAFFDDRKEEPCLMSTAVQSA